MYKIAMKGVEKKKTKKRICNARKGEETYPMLFGKKEENNKLSGRRKP